MEFERYLGAVCGLILMVALVIGAVSYATVDKIFRTATEVAGASAVAEASQKVEVEHGNLAKPDAFPLALISVLLLAAAAKHARIKPAGPSADSDKARTLLKTSRGGGKFWRAEQARANHDLHFGPRPPA
jgi:hypothetical protein